jgi:hypothetical protein
MSKKHDTVNYIGWLLLIFALVLITRLIFAYSYGTYSYSAYGEIRQIDHISKEGVHIINDPLSYGGRTKIILPLFHYFLGFSSTILPLDLVLKLFPNLFASLTVLMIFFIVLQMTKNKDAALFASFVGGFTPLLFWETIVSVSPVSLLIPLMLLFLYSFIRLNNRKFIILFIILSFVLPLISLSSLVLVFTFLIYLIFAKVERFQFLKRAKELTIMFCFFTIWFALMMFKKAFSEYGPNIIQETVPRALQSQYFQDLSFGQLFGGFGLLSLIVGSYVIYSSLFYYRDRNVYLFFSLILTLLAFMWLNLMRASLGLTLIAVVFSIFVGIYYANFFRYLNRTTLFHLKKGFVVLFIVLFIINSFLFSLILGFDADVAKKSEVRAMDWISKNTPEDAIIAAPTYFGHLITFAGQRRNVLDSDFLLAPQSIARFNSVNLLYSTASVGQAITQLDAFDAGYLLLPQGGIPEYLEDETCFNLLYNKDIKIYKKECSRVN